MNDDVRKVIDRLRAKAKNASESRLQQMVRVHYVDLTMLLDAIDAADKAVTDVDALPVPPTFVYPENPGCNFWESSLALRQLDRSIEDAGDV